MNNQNKISSQSLWNFQLKRAIKHIKCPGEYGPDEIYDGYNNFNGDNDFTDFKAKQMFTNSPPRRGTKRFAIVISYGSGIDGFDEGNNEIYNCK